jgi:hypothetical protein
MPTPKKAAKKAAKKAPGHHHDKHHQANDLRRAYEHMGRMPFLGSPLSCLWPTPLPNLRLSLSERSRMDTAKTLRTFSVRQNILASPFLPAMSLVSSASLPNSNSPSQSTSMN